MNAGQTTTDGQGGQIPVLLRYTYQLGPRTAYGVEAYAWTRSEALLYVDGEHVCSVSSVVRRMGSRTAEHWQPSVVTRHYYATLQEACEGAIKKLHREKKIRPGS